MRFACDLSRSMVTVSPGRTPGTKTGPDALSAMPSALAPRRVIVTCSVTARSQQKLTIAVPAFDRRGNEAQRREAEGCDEGGHALAHVAVHGLVAHDALLHALAARLELRLDENGQGRAGFQPCDGGGQDELEGDEAHIAHQKIPRLRE